MLVGGVDTFFGHIAKILFLVLREEGVEGSTV